MPKCANCPAKDLPWACAALARPHPRFCTLSDPDHPDHNPDYAATIGAWTEADAAAEGTDNRPAVDRAMHTRRAGRVLIRSYVISYSGYGQMAEALARGLEADGVPVAFEPVQINELHLPLSPWVLNRLDKDAPDAAELLIAGQNEPGTPGRRTLHFSMFETTGLLPKSVANLNAKTAVIVPCEWLRTTWLAAGVTAPIRVVPLGVDTAVFKPREGPRTARPVTFGAGARHAHGGVRKDVPGVIRAFLKAFPLGEPGSDGVRLRIKIWEDCPSFVEFPPEMETDPRIDVIRHGLTTEEMAEWYRSLDAFTSLSRGEGFGLMNLQAMSCGVPVIATEWSGHTAYFDSTVGYPLAYTMEPAFGVEYTGMGEWARPDFDHAVARMREVRDDLATAQAKGRAGAERAAGFTWTAAATKLRDVLEEFGFVAPKPQPADAPPSIFVADDAEHARIGAAMNACPHKETVEAGCCQKERCAPSGRKPGQWAGVALCYPCVRELLTIESKAG